MLNSSRPETVYGTEKLSISITLLLNQTPINPHSVNDGTISTIKLKQMLSLIETVLIQIMAKKANANVGNDSTRLPAIKKRNSSNLRDAVKYSAINKLPNTIEPSQEITNAL